MTYQRMWSFHGSRTPAGLPEIRQGEPGVVATLYATAVANAQSTACAAQGSTGQVLQSGLA